MSRVAKAYYWATVIAAVICWSPFKALAYVAPFLVTALLIIGGVRRLAIRVFWLAWSWGFMVAFYGLLNHNFQFENALVAFVTWFGMALILLIPTKGIGVKELLARVEKWAWSLLALESVWGIVQAFYGAMRTGGFDMANGDYVEGTIHPWLEPGLAYSNVMFAVNVALLLLFLLPSMWRSRHIWKVTIYGLGVLALVLASVVHVILFLAISVGASAVLLFRWRIRLSRLVGIGIFTGLLIGLTAAFLPRNLGTVSIFASQIFQGEVPKSVSVITAVRDLPQKYWFSPIFGLGPGQYASRAGLISTGLYFGGLTNPYYIPFLPNRLTKAQEEHLLPLWIWHESNPYWGSTQKSYFSWLAVYSEWGILGLVFVVGLLVGLLRRVKNLPSYKDVEKLVLGTTVVFLFLLGFQENNWEVTQAWFAGLLLIKILYANVRWNVEQLPGVVSAYKHSALFDRG
jgi:hypothetical protein